MSLSVPFVRREVTCGDDPCCRIALALWVAGCSKRCPGCQNPDLQDPAFGTEKSVKSICEMAESVLDVDLIGSVVFTGGDWAEYPEAYVEVAKWARSNGLVNVLYTGEFYEDLPVAVCEVTEWVIDGPFDIEQEGVFPPSKNQRVFRCGRPVDPSVLPLYRHLLSVQMVRVAGERE